MLNQNIVDSFFSAVEEYNRTVTNIDKKKILDRMTDKEKKGLFYNSIRRYLHGTMYSRYKLNVDDLECTFNNDYTIKNVIIKKNFLSEFISWDEKVNLGRNNIFQLKEVTSSFPVIYPTRILNEMSLIVNSLK